jgi:RimJ/RimL family protein N-acetyltransferase
MALLLFVGVFMLLTYENLTIRDAALEDAPLLCRWWNDGKVMAHAGFPNGLNTNPEKIARRLSSSSEDTFRILILEVNGSPIGEMNYQNKGNGIAAIGIKICDFSQQGKGYGTLFLKMLISGLFARGYKKIMLDTNVNNIRAQHVYEKLGFKSIRINHHSWMNQLGELQSSIDYELPASQFIPLDI